MSTGREAKLKAQLEAAFKKNDLGRALKIHKHIKKEFPKSRRATSSFDELRSANGH